MVYARWRLISLTGIIFFVFWGSICSRISLMGRGNG
nr:MAG TPA: hypothetical protein [Caudoviricetes sp.]